MTRFPFQPFPMPDPRLARGFAQLSLASFRMGVAANEVILRRMAMMAAGAMSGPEAARMFLEKPEAFAAGARKAGMAAARGAPAAKVMTAALGPVSAKARANARRLRK